MSATFNGTVNSNAVLAGIKATHGGIFNAYLHNSNEDSESKRFLVGLSLQEVEEANPFVAREKELLELGQLLKNGQLQPTAILRGLEGVGKTQLAYHYIKSHQTDYSAVIWLNAKDETSLKHSFKLVATHIFREQSSWVELKNAVKSGNDDDIVEAVKAWLGLQKNNKWLLVFDGYNPPKTTFGGTGNEAREAPKPYNIREFYPSTIHGSIIITTRSNQVKPGSFIRVGSLSEADSLNFLKSTSRKDVDNNAAAKQIAVRLRLPIELSAVVAFIEESEVDVSWEQCLTRCEEKKWNWRNFAAENDQTES